MSALVFYGKVDDLGHLKLNPTRSGEDGRVAMGKAVAKLAGQKVVVYMYANDNQPRTLPQNKFLHAHPFPIIADYQGQSVAETKLDLMGECWGWRESKLHPGYLVPIKPSTRLMTKNECVKFIDWLLPFALDRFGITLDTPKKYFERHPEALVDAEEDPDDE